jgi:hypothetical protein
MFFLPLHELAMGESPFSFADRVPPEASKAPTGNSRRLCLKKPDRDYRAGHHCVVEKLRCISWVLYVLSLSLTRSMPNFVVEFVPSKLAVWLIRG